MNVYEPPSPGGERHLALIIALEIGDGKEEMKTNDSEEIDESIRILVARSPMFLWGRTFGSFANDVKILNFEVHWTDGYGIIER